MAAAKCTVKFMRGRHGVDAVLIRKGVGASINYLPLGARPSVAAMRSAKKQLMRGCSELVRAHKRHSGMGGAFSVKDLWPFGKKKPAARHPMTRTVYVMKTKSGSYIPVDRPPNSMMAGARRRKKRRR